MGLLKFYFSASFFKSLLESFCSSLVYAFLNRSGSSIYDVLSFLKTKTTVFLNGLNNLELSSASALEDDVEGSLFFFCSGITTSSNYYCCSSCFNTVFVLKNSCKFAYFLYC